MLIGELARRSGTTVKALRYYEELGLLTPARQHNGYRTYGEASVRAVREIRELSELGVPARQAAPFIECLTHGHEHGDDCPASLLVYRDRIAELDREMTQLGQHRARLAEKLAERASVGFPERVSSVSVAQAGELPHGLPVPSDDGAASHLVGLQLPPLSLPATTGRLVSLRDLGNARSVVYAYPLTGEPGSDLPDGWEAIPGARGCTSEACDFRDHHDDLVREGVSAVYGLSSQSTGYQREVAARLRLPFAMLSDERFQLADALRLPSFPATGHERLYSRLTMVIRAQRIEHVFYPIFPPNTHAQQVLTWLRAHPLAAAR